MSDFMYTKESLRRFLDCTKKLQWKSNMFCLGCMSILTCKSPCVIGLQDKNAKEIYSIESKKCDGLLKMVDD
jgi:hypothetical protein